VILRFTPVAVIVAPFVPIPSALFYAAAGWEGMGLGWFLLYDAIGELLWAAALLWLGDLLGERAVRVVQVISTYGLWISLAIIALIVARTVWVTARRPPVPPPPA
jgi:membrane protein DedA with SNARE-associated domain